MATQSDELIDVTAEIRKALELARDVLRGLLHPTRESNTALDAVTAMLKKLN